MKQLLVILKLVLLAKSLCSLNNDIPQLATYPATLINFNLNSTASEYFINIDNSSSKTFAIAVNQMYTMSSPQWNVSLGVMNEQQIQIVFKNGLVNWGKVSLIIWGSQRSDLLLGSVSISNVGVMLDFGNSQLTSALVNISKISRAESSIVIPFISGFSSIGNSSINVNIVPYNLTANSFMVNITNENTALQIVSFFYTIFSPTFSSFQAFGDTLTISTQSPSNYYDVSQQIPDTSYKIYGFAGLKTKSIDFSFSTLINQQYILSFSSKSNQPLELVFQYIYLLPLSYTCKTCQNATIIFNNSCSYQCPPDYSVSYNGDFKYCSKCQKQLGFVYDSTVGNCVCLNGTLKNSYGKCVGLTNSSSRIQSNSTNVTSSERMETNATSNKSDHNVSTNGTNQINETTNITNSKANQTSNDSAKGETSKSQQKSTVTKTLNTVSKGNQSPKSSNSSNSTNSTVNTLPNCSKFQNTVLINGKCLCRVGFVNLSNICIPLVTIGTPYEANQGQPSYQISATTIAIQSGRSPCSENQSFSLQTGKCQCKPGFVINGKSCITICSKFQWFNPSSNNCLCIAGYTRLNFACVPCNNDPASNCYSLGVKKYCRAGYILANNSCIACSSVTIHQRINQICYICKDGFSYNGFNCVCTGKIANSLCYGQTCGNNKIQPSQTCDDGNVVNGDGCSSNCFIESDYFCSGTPSICAKTICGNSQITGAEECDDGNKKDGDGCSSLCLNQDKYTCIGTPSNCFNYTTGNLSLISITSNTNNVFLVFQTPQTYLFPYSAFMQSFLQYEYLSKYFSYGMVYCQQQALKLNRFDCLIIFPSGVPNKNFFMLFHYKYLNTSGSLIVNIQPSSSTSRSRPSSN